VLFLGSGSIRFSQTARRLSSSVQPDSLLGNTESDSAESVSAFVIPGTPRRASQRTVLATKIDRDRAEPR
jgi:hypothetical protein